MIWIMCMKNENLLHGYDEQHKCRDTESKIWFSSVLKTFLTSSPTNIDFLFLGGIRELPLDANGIQKEVNYRKASYLKGLNYFCCPL